MFVFGGSGIFVDLLIIFSSCFPNLDKCPPKKFNRDAGSLLESSRFWQKLLFQFLDMEVQCWYNIAGIDLSQLLLYKSFSVSLLYFLVKPAKQKRAKLFTKHEDFPWNTKSGEQRYVILPEKKHTIRFLQHPQSLTYIAPLKKHEDLEWPSLSEANFSGLGYGVFRAIRFQPPAIFLSSKVTRSWSKRSMGSCRWVGGEDHLTFELPSLKLIKHLKLDGCKIYYISFWGCMFLREYC